jgi:RNA recognition motif-containing protein
MAKRLYVGNLPYDVTADDLRQLFGKVGTVEDVHLPLDRQTGRPRGFAFVEMANDEQAKTAIHRYDG